MGGHAVTRSRTAQARAAARRTERTLGWVRAAQTGRIPQRVANHFIGSLLARITRGVWR